MKSGFARSTVKVETTEKAGGLLNALSKKGFDVKGIFDAVDTAVCEVLVLGINETGESIETLEGERVKITVSIDDIFPCIVKRGGN